MARSARGGRDGFTLVEVLVAFAIAALVLVMALRVMGDGAALARRGPAAALRLEDAASVIDRILAGPDLRPGDMVGTFADGRRWRARLTDVTPIVVPRAATALFRIDLYDGPEAAAPLLTTLGTTTSGGRDTP